MQSCLRCPWMCQSDHTHGLLPERRSHHSSEMTTSSWCRVSTPHFQVIRVLLNYPRHPRHRPRQRYLPVRVLRTRRCLHHLSRRYRLLRHHSCQPLHRRQIVGIRGASIAYECMIREATGGKAPGLGCTSSTRTRTGRLARSQMARLGTGMKALRGFASRTGE